MDINELIQLASHASKEKYNIKSQLVNFANYGFVFLDKEYFLERLKLEYSSYLCRIGSIRDYLKAYNQGKIKELDDFLAYKYDKSEDLYYVGAIKTLVPSLEIGGVELLFEVCMIVSTPYGKLFPATFYWGKNGLTIGCFKKELFGNIIGFKDSNLIDITFTLEEKEELAEALELALQKVPISDFEGDYFDDYGKTHMGIELGIPFMDFEKFEFIDYTITGSIVADEYYNDFDHFIFAKTISIFEERAKDLENAGEKHGSEKYRQLHNELYRIAINRYYDVLLECVESKEDRRIAFQVLGVLLMEYGAKMTDNIKKLILKNSHWRYERLMIKGRQDRIERRKNLYDFIEKILSYREGMIVNISCPKED